MSRARTRRRCEGVAILSLVAGLLASSPPPAGAATVPVRLTARAAMVSVAPGVRMHAWTFNGQVPGPVIRVQQGDTVRVTLRNAHRGRHGMWHSVDFHAAELAPSRAFVSVAPGKQHTFSFVARRPGVFMYHCGTSPMLEHVGMGMYGAIVVDPKKPRPRAREITLVQSEFYGKLHGSKLHPSLRAMRTQPPRFAAFNGKAFRYDRHPISVPVGKPVRIYLVDAGPNLDSAFHVVGTIFDTVEPDGNPAFQLHDVSTQLVPAGGGSLFELTFHEPGSYPFVTHELRLADAGAMGRFEAR